MSLKFDAGCRETAGVLGSNFTQNDDVYVCFHYRLTSQLSHRCTRIPQLCLSRASSPMQIKHNFRILGNCSEIQRNREDAVRKRI